MFSTVLIADRGESALRVARTCRELGIRTVADDRDAAVGRLADETVRIAPGVPALIEAARRTGAQAVHPGDGPLAEDAGFAEACAADDITFIGPSPAVLARLGDKTACLALLAEAGLPVIPRSGPLASPADAKEAAQQSGYPVILRAVTDNGRTAVVRDPDDLLTAYALLGDERLIYLERHIPDARRIEVQVFRDRHGAAVHLGERDCTARQGRHRLVAECPAPGLPPRLRTAMCEAAVRGALALGYTGAGTFEFVVPPAPAGARDFHLTGVGCRLSPGHPVTELVTGIDLVREQILVSAGFPLSFAQDGIRPRGAAVQCHVRATPGLLTGFAPPGGPFVRVDTHAYAGWRVGTDEGDGYDSPLAKVCAWAPDRERALARADRALEEFRIAGDGVRTTVESLRTVLADPAFRSPTHLKGRTG